MNCKLGFISFSGKYLFIETSSPRKTGDKAWLVSDYFNRSITCFTFWYHMYGRSIGALNIYQQPLGGQKVLLWKLSGNKGNKWFSGQVMADFSLTEHRVSCLFGVAVWLVVAVMMMVVMMMVVMMMAVMIVTAGK